MRRLAALLTELETAAGAVLSQQFQWTPEQAGQFTERLREKFAARKGGIDRLVGEKRLAAAAQLFGLSGMEVLAREFEFTPEMAARWLQELIAQGNKGRGLG